MIQFEQVSFSHTSSTGNHWPVIKQLSLTIQSGEKVAIIGANGSGKTTLGLLLCGILKPSSGKITVNGHDASHPAEISPIGMLFQDPDNGLVAVTVEREAAFSLENRNVPSEKIRSSVDALLDKFRLAQYRSESVWQLSGGEKQRLALASLLIDNRLVLFLDEPASFLDFKGEQVFESTLKEIISGNPDLTVIRVTQFPDIADGCDRVIFLSKGEIVQDGAPAELFQDRSPFVGSGLRPPLKYLPIKNMPESHQAGLKEAGSDRLVKIDAISFSYSGEDKLVLERMSLDLFSGETLALVGPSGCGKSTVAQILSGIYKPLSGVIEWAKEGMRTVMTFQQPERQFFLETCFDEIAIGLKQKDHSDDQIKEAVQTGMDRAGLDYDQFARRAPYTLSGGEARRLAFAIVLALDFDLIIFDEPTCGLDEDGIILFRRMVRRLSESNKGVMIITHNSNIIGDLADKIALLQNGAISGVVSPLEFYKNRRYEDIIHPPELIVVCQDRSLEPTTMKSDLIFELDQFTA